MRNRLATIFCFVVLFFSGSFSQAATGEFSLGVNVETSYIQNNKKAFEDYWIFRPENSSVKGFYPLHNGSSELFNFSLVPITVGINVGYSYYFTNKLGVAFLGNLCQGNLAVVTLNKDKVKTLGKTKGFKTGSDVEIDRDPMAYKVSMLTVGGDVRLKYDLVGSSLDFEDYGRNSLKMDINLGIESNWCFSPKFLKGFTEYGSSFGPTMDNDTGNKSKVLFGERINCWQPGVVLGFTATTPFNVGVALDLIYFFRNIFSADDKVKSADEAWKKEINSGGVKEKIGIPEIGNPHYSTACSLFQFYLRFFYDFAPFFNNHEALSEMDIEKW